MNILKAIKALAMRSPEPLPSGLATEQALRLIDEGNDLEDGGDLAAAMQRYEAALSLAPTLGRAHLNRGNVLLNRGDYAGALKAFETALLHQSQYPGAYFNMGNALRASGRLGEAISAYDSAIAQKPDFQDAKITRASVLDDMGRFEESVVAYREVLGMAPDFCELRCDLAHVLSRQGKFTDALAEYRWAVQGQPGLAKAHSGTGNILKDMGQIDDAMASFNNAIELQPDNASAVSGLLFVSNYRKDQPETELVELARRYGSLVQRQAHRHTVWRNIPDPDRLIRVGFVSGDLRAHPVSYFLEGVLAALAAQEPAQMALHAYASTSATDIVTQRLMASCDGWHVVAELTDERLAELVHSDGIDILIDLSGHTGHNRLSMFAWKPAPIQVSWLGYFATTGVAEIDYLIADSWSLPESEDANFVETIWRLPETRLCFTPPDEKVAVSDLPALRNGYITFGCFNHLAKMNDAVVALWAKLLQSIPDSRLLLKSPPLVEKVVRTSVLQRFAQHGIDPARIMTEGLSSRQGYLEAYCKIDVALDPFPYPGGTTSAESLWMGVPVLTMAGKRFLSRQGSGLLKSAGLGDWIADDEDAYLHIALTRTANLDALSTLRRNLRAKVLASTLFDAARFADQFAQALRGMWRHWCSTKN